MSTHDSIAPLNLSRQIGSPRAPLLVDVRTDEEFSADPRFIPGAIRRNPALIAGSTSLSVASVNSQGVAVGAAYSPNGYTAVLWPAGSTSSTVPVDLNANQAFAPIGALNVRAIDLNEAGTVLTGYNDAKGHFYTFLLRP